MAGPSLWRAAGKPDGVARVAVAVPDEPAEPRAAAAQPLAVGRGVRQRRRRLWPAAAGVGAAVDVAVGAADPDDGAAGNAANVHDGQPGVGTAAPADAAVHAAQPQD